MATKTTSRRGGRKSAAKRPAARKSSSTPARKAAPPRTDKDGPFPMMTPEQAIELYKSNAKMALDVINAAIENTGKLRRLQFEGEEESRAMGRKVAKKAAEAGSADEMMAAGQEASQAAVEHAMRYWGQMFDLISEMQKRLWVMMEEQMQGVPGVKEARAAMEMMPDLRQAQNVIKAMQGVVSSGGNAFETMQKVMGDFSRYLPGMKR